MDDAKKKSLSMVEFEREVMMVENFEQQLDDLRNGKIDHFEITPENFQAFQRVYHAYPYRTQIEGKANIGGKITYHLRQR